MNWLGRVFRPQFFLRLGLGAMYAWSGIDLIVHPIQWADYLNSLPPQLLKAVEAFGTENFLFVQGLVELAIAFALLAWFLPRWLVGLAALISAAEIAAILWFVGVDLVTFRDLGLLGASLAVVSLAFRHHYYD